MFRSVLIVCHANVCRSPAAEMLFRAYAGKLAGKQPRRPIEFRSAGLFAEDGRNIDSTMYRLLAERDWPSYTLFDVTYQPDRLSVEELEAGFRAVVREAFGAAATARRQAIRKETWQRHPRLRP